VPNFFFSELNSDKNRTEIFSVSFSGVHTRETELFQTLQCWHKERDICVCSECLGSTN